jgi:Central domain of human glycogen debranching enzyme
VTSITKIGFLAGVMSILNKIRASNDLGHPLCDNLRRGDWLLDYIANRLLKHPGTMKVCSKRLIDDFAVCVD